jgi:hypothetical protein
MALALTSGPVLDKLLTKEGITMVGVLADSAIGIAIMGAFLANVQWNLEHINLHVEMENNRPIFEIRKLSTLEVTDVDSNDPKKVGTAPPVMSMAARAADAAMDTAESAERLATASIDYATHQVKKTQERGLLGNLLAFVVGEGK